MKALVKSKAEPGLWLEDVPEPSIGINDVLIKVEKTGICGTDVHIFKWDAWASKTVPVPLTIGHEFVGSIVEIGSNVRDFKIGDVVSGEGHVVCGHCRNCMAGRRHLCHETFGVGVHRPGAFAEYISLPQTNIWYHDPSLPREIMALFDPFGNAVHAALSFDVLGEDVLITGAGPIGCMAAAVCRHAGARHVVVTDPNEWRRGLANTLGATRVVDPTREKLADVQKELGMAEGFDIGLEMSGVEAGFHDLLDNMCHGGRVALLGIPTKPVTLDLNQLIFDSLIVKGVYGREMYETWYQMTAMLQSGLDISPVITHRFDYREFNKAFETAMKPESGKILLQW